MRGFTFSLSDLFTVVTVLAVNFAAFAADCSFGGLTLLFSGPALATVLYESSQRRRQGVPASLLKMLWAWFLLSISMPLAVIVSALASISLAGVGVRVVSHFEDSGAYLKAAVYTGTIVAVVLL